MKPHSNAMRSNLCFVENPDYRGSTYGDSRVSTTKSFQKRIERPEISSPLTKVRRTPTCHAEQLAATQQPDSRWSARTGTIFQGFLVALSDKAIAPPADCLDVDLQMPRGLTHARVPFKCQQDSRSKNFPMRATILASNLRQLSSLFRCQTYPFWCPATPTLSLHARNLITSDPEVRSNYWGETFGPRN